MKRLALAALAAMVAIPAAAAETYSLRFGTFLPPVSALVTKTFAPWAETLAKESGGRLEIKIFPGGALGKNPAAQLKLVKDGITDIAFVVPSYTPGEFPDNEVIELPLTTDDGVVASKALYALLERKLLRGYEDVKVVALFTTPTYNLHLRAPYEGIASLKGRKIRVSTKVQQAIVEQLGATPVGNIPVIQVAESLGRGLIDGTLLGWESMLVFKVTPTVTHHVRVPLGFTPLAVFMNKAKYEAMPADLKAVFDRYAGAWMVERAASTNEGTAATALKIAKGSDKHVFVEPKGQSLEEWKAALRSTVEGWPGSHERGKVLHEALLTEIAKAGSAK